MTFRGFSGLVWGSGSRVPAYFGPVLFDPCSAEVTPNNMSHNTSLLKDAGVSVTLNPEILNPKPQAPKP